MYNQNPDPLLNIHHFCKKHYSEIGGICDQIFCDDEQMKCIKCISDNDGCIRSKKHNFVSFFLILIFLKLILNHLNILILLNHIVKVLNI